MVQAFENGNGRRLSPHLANRDAGVFICSRWHTAVCHRGVLPDLIPDVLCWHVLGDLLRQDCVKGLPRTHAALIFIQVTQLIRVVLQRQPLKPVATPKAVRSAAERARGQAPRSSPCWCALPVFGLDSTGYLVPQGCKRLSGHTFHPG